MKISTGISTGITTLSPIDSAKILKSIGYDGIDYGFAWSYSTTNIFNPGVEERIIAEAESYKNLGLEISQAHLHYLSSEFYGPGLYPQFEEKYLAALIREIELCGLMGCPVAVLHTYFELDREATIKGNKTLFDKLLPYLEKHKVKLALENVFGGGDAEYGRYNNATAEDFMVYFEDYKSPYLGACLDTGHANCVGESPIEMAKIYGKYLYALHMNCNDGRDIHMIPGFIYPFADPVNWQEFANTLKTIDYQGTYNLEICGGCFPHDPISGISYLQMAYNTSKAYLKKADLL